MTKRWEDFREIIPALYRKNTLATVRQKMIDKYGFQASTRAYRQRLERWGVHKYKPRTRNILRRVSTTHSTNRQPSGKTSSNDCDDILLQFSDNHYASKALFNELAYQPISDSTACTPSSMTTTPTSTVTTLDSVIMTHEDAYDDEERRISHICQQSSQVSQELTLVDHQLAFLAQTAVHEDSYNKYNQAVDQNQFLYPSPCQWITYSSG